MRALSFRVTECPVSARRFGVPCVTLDGKKHAKGSVEGGHRAAQSLASCADKLAFDSAATCRDKARAALDAANKEVGKWQAALDQYEDQDEQLAQLQSALEAAEAEAGDARRGLRTATNAKACAEQQHAELQRALVDTCSSAPAQGDDLEGAKAASERVAKEIALLKERCTAAQRDAEVRCRYSAPVRPPARPMHSKN